MSCKTHASFSPTVFPQFSGMTSTLNQHSLLEPQWSLVEGLRQYREKMQRSNQKPLKNRTFCITGTLSQPRSAMIGIIERLGGDFQSSITYGVDYLIVGDTKSWGNTKKKKDAADKSVRAISEPEFAKMMQDQNYLPRTL